MKPNTVKMLGAFGSKGENNEMTSLQVSNSIVIDAGNILNSLKEKALGINHILLTHTHLDHIVDIPFLIDTFYDQRTEPLIIYGLEETIQNLEKHLFNWHIWPDFSSINLKNSSKKAVIFKKINIGEEILIDGCLIKPIKTEHTNSSCGYVINKGEHAIFFTSDTYKCQNIWDEINSNKKIKSLIIEVSFPSSFEQLAKDSKHLTPKLLHEELKNLKRNDLSIYINHLKSSYIEIIQKELYDLDIFKNHGHILDDGAIIDIVNPLNYSVQDTTSNDKIVKQLLDIGYSLTSEKDIFALMEKILVGAKQLSNADAGTLYMIADNNKELEFKVVQTDSLNIKMGGTNGEINWPNVLLKKEDGTYNKEQVAALCAIDNKLINISDVYNADDFSFEGTKKFDKNTGYRSKSMLVIPMKNHEDKVIGVIQLLNKLDDDGDVIDFNKADEELILSMSSQAAVSVTTFKLIEELENLLDAFLHAIADAIGEKSEYTQGHINRVATLATMIAQAINDDTNGIYKDIHYSKNELQEISIAAWMHDIGKITTPEYIVDKATKLETISDRINGVEAKFEILKRDIEISYLKNEISQKDFETKNNQIDDDLAFIQMINSNGSYLTDDKKDKIYKISQYNIKLNNSVQNILTSDELYNLQIERGTLTDSERDIINNHVIVSYDILKKLPFPKKYENVPLIAGSHHKKIKLDENGVHMGYGATEIMGIPLDLKSKILVVADIFEALTAHDRPYRNPNTLNQSLKILSFMVKDEELDKDLVKFFVQSGLANEYGESNLLKSQLDEINIDFDNL